MKKAILLALCIALVGMLAVDGTFAADFTQIVGNAFTSLFKTIEGLADSIGQAPTSAPETFKVELVYPDGSQGMTLLSPGATAARKVAVQNQSTDKPAYFRIAFAVQADVREHLTLNLNNNSVYTWSEWRESITIGGNKFDLIIGTYTEALAAGDTSEAALFSVKLENITSQQMNAFSKDFLQIRVLAVDASAFEDALASNTITPDAGQTQAEAVLDKALPIDSLDFNPFE